MESAYLSRRFCTVCRSLHRISATKHSRNLSVRRLAGKVLCRGHRAAVSPSVVGKEHRSMLRHITSTLTACTLAGIVSVSAQQPAPAQQPQPPQQPQEQQQAPKETITGCVVEAKTTDGG